MQRSRNDVTSAHEHTAGETESHEAHGSQRFSTAGAIPPVMAAVEPHRGLSPSERAYGGDDGPLSANGHAMEREMEIDHAVIAEASKRYGIPEVDILAVITQESKGVATANAGARQKDHGAHAASGLMQVTEDTWRHTQTQHAELSGYSFSGHRYDRRANILVGTAALADKREALRDLGVPATGPNATALTTMAFNAGEGIVSDAYHRAVRAGASNPGAECLRAEFLKPAIAKYPSVYSYYLTGGGKSKNPHHSVAVAVDLKFQEISKYPTGVEMLIAEATDHELATKIDGDIEMPLQSPTMVASVEPDSDKREA